MCLKRVSVVYLLYLPHNSVIHNIIHHTTVRYPWSRIGGWRESILALLAPSKFSALYKIGRAERDFVASFFLRLFPLASLLQAQVPNHCRTAGVSFMINNNYIPPTDWYVHSEYPHCFQSSALKILWNMEHYSFGAKKSTIESIFFFHLIESDSWQVALKTYGSFSTTWSDHTLNNHSTKVSYVAPRLYTSPCLPFYQHSHEGTCKHTFS